MIAFALTATAAATLGFLTGALCAAAKHADQPFLLPGTWIVDVDPNGTIVECRRDDLHPFVRSLLDEEA